MKSSGVSHKGSENSVIEISLEEFWRLTYGDQEGYLGLTSGEWDSTADDGKGKLTDVHDWNGFRWPKQADQAAEWCRHKDAAGREVYQCGHLLLHARRLKPNAAPASCLYADDVPTDHPLLKDRPPTASVETSPGKRQCFWALTRALEPAEFEQINRRLAYALGPEVFEQGTWNLTRVLRTPHTHNRKYPPLRFKVRISALTQIKYTPEEFDEYLPSLSPDPHQTTNPHKGGGHWVTEKLRAGLKDGVDRNTSMTRIAGYLLTVGLPWDLCRELLSVVSEARCFKVQDGTRVPAPMPEGELDKIFASVLRNWKRQRTETLPAAVGTLLEFMASPGARECSHGQRSTYQALCLMAWHKGVPDGDWVSFSFRQLENYGSAGRKSLDGVLHQLAKKRYIEYEKGEPFKRNRVGKLGGERASRVRLLPLPESRPPLARGEGVGKNFPIITAMYSKDYGELLPPPPSAPACHLPAARRRSVIIRNYFWSWRDGVVRVSASSLRKTSFKD